MKLRMLFISMCWLALSVEAQEVELNPQRNFPKTVPPGNYSGITWLGGRHYAVVDDKSPTAGFYLMTIITDSISGELLEVRADRFMTSGAPNRDEEGICYVPHTNTIFTSGEADNEIIEYTIHGQLTGRRLNIPEVFKTAYSDFSLEALTYNANTHRFWTTSEQTLRADGPQPSIHYKHPNRLRFQSFDDDLQPREQYWYQTDSTQVTNEKGRDFLGVSAMAALDDGRLLVLEREARITSRKVGSFVHIKIYVVHPQHNVVEGTSPQRPLKKHLLVEFRTKMNLTTRNFANYEGLCVGPKLTNGSTLLVLVADSQNQYKGWLKDWFKTIVLPPHFKTLSTNINIKK